MDRHYKVAPEPLSDEARALITGRPRQPKIGEAELEHLYREKFAEERRKQEMSGNE